MAEIVLFHHAQGLTPGVAAFADEWRHAGHLVHTPDLFEGRTFDSIEKGMRFVKELGFGEVMERGERAVEELPAEVSLCRVFSRCGPRAEVSPDPAWNARGASLLFVCAGLGVWANLAKGGACSGAWHGCRSDLRG